MPNRATSFFATRRFHPTPLPTLGMLVLVALTVALGNWQRHRAGEKEALAAQYAAAAREPPVAVTGREVDPVRLRFRVVRATGEFDAARQLLIDNKVHAGRPGFHVVTPLKLGAGDRHVLVDRGWVAQAPRRADLPQVPPPAGVVTITGSANLPPRRYVELKADTADGPVWQNLDIDRIAVATGLKLLPIVIEQFDVQLPADGLIRDWPEPDFGVEAHLGYMLQWYSLAALAIVLWLTLNWRREDPT